MHACACEEAGVSIDRMAEVEGVQHEFSETEHGTVYPAKARTTFPVGTS